MPIIVVLGNIAAGKTTLSEVLAERLQMVNFQESPQANEFLVLMQQDAHRWCLANQIWFLCEASESIRQAGLSGGILDHCVEEVFPIHSRVFREQGFLTEDEYDLLSRITRAPLSLRGPDLYVVVEAPADVLVTRVKDRQRVVDNVPTVAYLDMVSLQRNAFLNESDVPSLRISSVDFDFRVPEHADMIAETVHRALAAKAAWATSQS